MRRFTRLTNAFSMKLDNHIHALALYFVFYNFTRIHKTLRMTADYEDACALAAPYLTKPTTFPARRMQRLNAPIIWRQSQS